MSILDAKTSDVGQQGVVLDSPASLREQLKVLSRQGGSTLFIFFRCDFFVAQVFKSFQLQYWGDNLTCRVLDRHCTSYDWSREYLLWYKIIDTLLAYEGFVLCGGAWDMSRNFIIGFLFDCIELFNIGDQGNGCNTAAFVNFLQDFCTSFYRKVSPTSPSTNPLCQADVTFYLLDT